MDGLVWRLGEQRGHFVGAEDTGVELNIRDVAVPGVDLRIFGADEERWVVSGLEFTVVFLPADQHIVDV